MFVHVCVHLCVRVQVLRKPYKLHRMNNLESMTLLVLAITMYLAAFFLVPGLTNGFRRVGQPAERAGE